VDPVRIFVTTCPEMWRAEIALEYSIYKYAKSPVSVTFLRSGDPGWRTNVDEGLTPEQSRATRPDLWNVGRAHPRCYSGEGWATPFTCFRFAIPELCGFEGRAIHMDIDFLVLKDLRPVFEHEMKTPLVGPGDCRTDFMVMDCSAFKGLDWWPSMAQMRPSGWQIEKHYKRALQQRGFMSSAPHNWESWDGTDWVWHQRPKGEYFDSAQSQDFGRHDFYAVHFTNMHTQPWKPMPHNFQYPPHPQPVVAYMWWEHYAEALEKIHLGLFRPQTHLPAGLSYADVGQVPGLEPPRALHGLGPDDNAQRALGLERVAAALPHRK